MRGKKKFIPSLSSMANHRKKIPVFHTGTHILNGLWNNDGVMGKGR